LAQAQQAQQLLLLLLPPLGQHPGWWQAQSQRQPTHQQQGLGMLQSLSLVWWPQRQPLAL
jgi:hypothetical protein